MKRVATSIVLACANLVLVGLGYVLAFVDSWKHVLPEELPAPISLLPGLIVFVVIPLLGLATVVIAIKDLFRAGTRWQAVIACILFIPVAIIYSRPE
jgi:hypothetical protein